VLNDPKFCPLETQFKYIEQAHCSTESLVVSSSGWLAITMGWNLFCDRRFCCDVTSLVPQTFPISSCFKDIWEEILYETLQSLDLNAGCEYFKESDVQFLRDVIGGEKQLREEMTTKN